MSEEKEPAAGIDYTALADALDDTREMLRGMVAGFVVDGFTDREAHAIVAKMMGYPPDEEEVA